MFVLFSERGGNDAEDLLIIIQTYVSCRADIVVMIRMSYDSLESIKTNECKAKSVERSSERAFERKSRLSPFEDASNEKTDIDCGFNIPLWWKNNE